MTRGDITALRIGGGGTLGRRARLLALGCGVLALGGCMDDRAQRQQSQPMPQPVAGTWVQVRGLSPDKGSITDPQRIGFMNFSTEQVVVDLEGVPQLIAAPTAIAIDPVSHSGCVTLDDGVSVYLTGGETVVQQTVGAQVESLRAAYLDVDLIGSRAPNSGLLASHLRLWSEGTLRQPVLVTRAAEPAGTSALAAGAAPLSAVAALALAVAAVSAPASPIEDLRQRVAALDVPELQSAVRELEQAQAKGQPAAALDAIIDRYATAVRRDLLARLELTAASDDPDQTEAALAEVARRQRALDAFATIVANWLMRS